MPKTLGIIAEYDPFHRGHEYCLSEARQKSDAERVVCVMSGAFVQRGEPALFDKYVRAEAAVKNGVDLVLELPFCYAATGAENFSRGGVRVLTGLGICDAIAFGSERAAEVGDAAVSELLHVAELLAFETKSFSEKTKAHIKTGISFPAARQIALAEELGQETAALMRRPNDILAVEYLRQLTLLKAERASKNTICFRPSYLAFPTEKSPENLEIIAIPRFGAEPGGINVEQGIAGAGAIRALIRSGRIGKAFAFVPDRTKDVLASAIIDCFSSISAWGLKTDPNYEFNFSQTKGRGAALIYPEDLFQVLELSALTLDPIEAGDIYTAVEGLEHRLLDAAGRAANFTELIDMIKSKRYTETRILRFVLHTALRLMKAEMKEALSERICVRVLAFNQTGAEILREIHEMQAQSDIYVFQNLRVEQEELSSSRTLVALGVRADKLYHMLGHGSLEGFRYSPEPVRL